MPEEIYTFREVDGQAFIAPDHLKQYISPMLDAVLRLQDAMDPLYWPGHDVAVTVEMHPAAFRSLIAALHVHLGTGDVFRAGSKKPDEFQIYNITFRAVPPERSCNADG